VIGIIATWIIIALIMAFGLAAVIKNGEDRKVVLKEKIRIHQQ